MFIFTFICSLFINKKREYEKPSRFFRKMLGILTSIAFFAARIRLHVSGEELLPERNFLIVSNHISNFDPILTWKFIGLDKIIFITKPENFKQPFFGRIIHRLGFLGIDRENPRNALKTIQKAAKVLKQGEMSVGVYPEGTRNRSAEGLLPFHNGSLKMAQLAEVPIVVVYVRDSHLIAKHFPWKGTDVYLDILKVIPEEEVASGKTVDIGNSIREMMLKRAKA